MSRPILELQVRRIELLRIFRIYPGFRLPNHIYKDDKKRTKAMLRKFVFEYADKAGLLDKNKAYIVRGKDVPELLIYNVKLFERKKKNSRNGKLLASILGTPSGMRAIANAFANPLRRNLDYQGIARQAIRVEPIDEKAT